MLELKRFYRSKTNYWLTGVCGGFAQDFSLDANYVRLLFVFFASLTFFFPFAFAYLLASLILPRRDHISSFQRVPKLHRSLSDQKLLGVCAGLAHYWKVDPTLVRLIVGFFACFYFMVLWIAYLLAYFLLPLEKEEIPLQSGKKLCKFREETWIGGVCGALGIYFSIDPNLLRIGFVFLSVLTLFLPFLVFYLFACYIIPWDDS